MVKMVWVTRWPEKIEQLLPGRKERVGMTALYKARICLMENSYTRFKQFRTISICYNKGVASFPIAIYLAASLPWFNE